MLDIKFIRENAELIKKAAKNKNVKCDIDRLVEVDQKRRDFLPQIESMRSEQKNASEEIAKADKAKKAGMIAEMKKVSEKLKKLESELQGIEVEFKELMYTVPSIPDEEVPVGKDESENIEIKKWGEVPQFKFEPKDHITLGQDLDIVDFERGAKLSGSRFYFLKNAGALLELAVLRFALDHIISKGFTPMITPLLVRDEAMYGTGYFPFGKEEAYYVEKDELSLIGTAEVPVTAYHMDEILEESELPKMYAGLSSCFRREAGSYGKDTKGLYRIHQFQKVEQVIVCKNDTEESKKHHQFILQNSEEVLQALKLPYRVMNLCTGDLGAGQIQKFDIETWMPSRKGYGETHSASRFYDYQARRANLKYRDKDGKIHFCHTLNNTVIASPRILIPILENYQQADGSVIVPEVLRPYMGGMERIKMA
ncbi:MAG: serine--tRNA ligase [Candidatus Gracilibacteria bacterium]|nr:serine--tRNA ligase [Candidatus Gracilibacteria bacterium]